MDPELENVVQQALADALAAGIRELLDDPQRRASLGKDAREGVEARFSWRRVTEATVRVYRDVLDERRGRPARTITSAQAGAFCASPSST